jgi:hypothetical protein
VQKHLDIGWLIVAVPTTMGSSARKKKEKKKDFQAGQNQKIHSFHR